MGGIMSRFKSFLGKSEVRILMLGLDNAGKTTLLFQLKLGEVVSTRTTLGYNLETVHYKRINFTVFDLGGQRAIRELWYHYYPNTDAIIFVVDASDLLRIEEAKKELHNMFSDRHLKKAALLIYANKSDKENALCPDILSVRLDINSLRVKKKCHIEACSATTGDGVFEGLDKLRNMLINK